MKYHEQWTDFLFCLLRSKLSRMAAVQRPVKYSDILTGKLKCKFLFISALVLRDNLNNKENNKIIYCFVQV